MTVTHTIQATPDEVFAVLGDGWLYSNWVVGTSHMRAVQSTWPQVGSKLFHASGVWPVVTRDETVVLESQPPTLLVLQAKGGPLGQARIELRLHPQGAACEVDMDETPVQGPGRWMHNPLTAAAIHRRNIEALNRLATLVERRTTPPPQH
ncbi:SRPBCC family protein [Allobranchiibius sp. CTAmp26]|uniref:SRPBCC family protein n=1 Tax=Allobranchiibius sp. CTAmp26 TaxID=2815214 RepID=UPI001AA1AAA5|nr:SRPBCC family protein [Allobranchiibius sp. CTAmp26]MBO1756491.1 SRPBCC family protein [Allobranchiibius sp. CTAmp26]